MCHFAGDGGGMSAERARPRAQGGGGAGISSGPNARVRPMSPSGLDSKRPSPMSGFDSDGDRPMTLSVSGGGDEERPRGKAERRLVAHSGWEGQM